jgi:hypothetical protein
VIVKVVDFGKVQARMDAALQKQAHKNLFRSYDQAMSTLRDVYLKNLADPNGKPSAEALGGGVEGARKRNFFNEVMGAVPKKGDVMINEPTAGYTASRKGGSVYEDLRIERVQNVEQTGMKIPWSGDMGEQSSYRRTQLNFQPAETIGDKSVESDANAGFRILSSRGKFRLYSPDGDLLGIYDSAGQAKLKAEKTYATQTRIQSEIDQQQRLPGDEGRQTAEAGGGDRPVSSTKGREEGGQELGQVRQAGDVGARFMPSDSDYMAAVKSGTQDVQSVLSAAPRSERKQALILWQKDNPDAALKLQGIVDQAAKDAGFMLSKVYHGTKKNFFKFDARKGKENEIRDAVRTPNFFSFDRSFSEDYANYDRPANDKIPAKVIEAYIKVDNLWDYRNQADVDKAVTAGFSRKQIENGNWREIESPKFQQWLKENNYDGFTNFERFATNIAVFDPNRIKSADPVTFDGSGKVIPPSRRFDTSTSDIRYMPALVPDPSIPGAYSMNGYRILPGKTKGKLRVYSPSGALVGVVGSVDDAQRMIQKKLQ